MRAKASGPYLSLADLADLAEQQWGQLREGLRRLGLDPDESPVPPIRHVMLGKSLETVDAHGRRVVPIHGSDFDPFDEDKAERVGWQLCMPSVDGREE